MPSELRRTRRRRTSENNPSSNCLENRKESRSGVPKAAKVCLSAAIGRFLPPTEHAREARGYFPNSFSSLSFNPKGYGSGSAVDIGECREHDGSLWTPQLNP